jgi:hypothetical protein
MSVRPADAGAVTLTAFALHSSGRQRQPDWRPPAPKAGATPSPLCCRRPMSTAKGSRGRIAYLCY